MFESLIVGVIAVCVGVAGGYAIRQLKANSDETSSAKKAAQLVQDAKNKQQEILLEAKDKALKVIEDAKKEEQERRLDLQKTQERVEKRESLFDQKLLDLEHKKEELGKKEEEVQKSKAEIQEIKKQQLQKLEKVGELSVEQAREVVMKYVEKDQADALASRVRKLQEEGSEVYDTQARKLLTEAIQRCGMSHAAETTSTVMHLPSDEMKGRIIGREGRNIKRIEELTGAEIIVDDTPESILISAFSPVRRHVAKRALDKLIADGRIHPTKIEDAVEAAKKEIAGEVKKAGEEALYEMGITGIDPKLVQILGRLRYRTSYGQNVLRHSIEVGALSGLIAEELGADVAMSKKAGLFHDIGKALDHDIQGTHPEIGRDIGRKFGFSKELSDAAFCHHDDYPPTMEGVIVKVADCISGSRPGARKDSYEQYIQRLEELENTALAFDGVQKVYAIQAGREIRVFVEPDKVDDYSAQKMARDIAKKIEEELKYPGEIKVNVIRETRIVEYAR
ncbi:MAG: ribonuclease Y [Candidatus Kerfeldbacteria bacterium]|nr:ribonuclease Y [Candidatus Kerfeldbacteria bacterium]